MNTPDKFDIEDTLNNIAEPEKAKKVIRWFATPEGERFLSEQMNKDWNAISNNGSADHGGLDIPSNEMFESIMKQIHNRNKKRMLLAVAAIALPFLLLSGLYIEVNNRLDLFSEIRYEEISVPKGEQAQFIFQDGSRVYLNSGSKLRFPKKFGLRERKVELEGEGFFEIASNKKRPFVVDMKSISITVSGTSFNTKAYPDEDFISVSLESGDIELGGIIPDPFYVKPGEKVVYNREYGTYEIIRAKNIRSYSAWKQKKLVFEDTPLAEVTATLSRAFDVRFEIPDQAVLKYNFTLYTDKNDLHFILKELEKIAPIYFEIKEDCIYIKSDNGTR